MSEQANILIVDDDETVADLLSAGLEENEGYHCFAVATGEDDDGPLPQPELVGGPHEPAHQVVGILHVGLEGGS